MLEIKNIKKSFGQTDVLHDISLSVNKGDVIAILGPSGSGKTTLLRFLTFLAYRLFHLCILPFAEPLFLHINPLILNATLLEITHGLL